MKEGEEGMAQEINLTELLENKANEAASVKGGKEGMAMLKSNGGNSVWKTDDEIRDFIENELKEGVDYGTVKGASKPSLWKAGAEKLCRFMGLSALGEIISRYADYDAGVFGFEAKVRLVDADGIIRGEGFGACNTRENKYLKSSAFNNANTALKMSKKRALVDAILGAAGASAVFTQDAEDLAINGTEGGLESAMEPTVKKASARQLDYLSRLMEKHHTSAASMDAFVKKNFGLDSFREISSSQASELIEKFKAVA